MVPETTYNLFNMLFSVVATYFICDFTMIFWGGISDILSPSSATFSVIVDSILRRINWERPSTNFDRKSLTLLLILAMS